MSLRLYQIAVDAHDPEAQSGWWAQALRWQVLYEEDGEFIIGTDEYSYPGILFLGVPEDKVIKNRLHLDFDPDDQDAEVARLIAMGATPVDVGQGEVSWVVLADPEGNEFCVLRPHKSLIE